MLESLVSVQKEGWKIPTQKKNFFFNGTRRLNYSQNGNRKKIIKRLDWTEKCALRSKKKNCRLQRAKVSVAMWRRTRSVWNFEFGVARLRFKNYCPHPRPGWVPAGPPRSSRLPGKTASSGTTGNRERRSADGNLRPVARANSPHGSEPVRRHGARTLKFYNIL